MINIQLTKTVEEAKKPIIATVFYKWLALIANIILTHVFVMILVDINLGSPLEIPFYFWIALLIKGIALYKSSRAMHQTSTCVKIKMRSLIFGKLFELGSDYQTVLSSSEITQVSTEGVEQLENYFALYTPQFIYSLLAPLTLFVFLLQYSFKVSLILFICVPLIPISIIIVQKFAKKLLNKYWSQYTSLGDHFLENLQGLTTLKVFDADGLRQDLMDEDAESFRKVTMRVLIMQLNSISVMDLVAYGGAMLALVVSVFTYKSGSLSLTGMLLFILLSSEFFIPMRQLGSYFHIAMNGMAASEKMFKLLATDAGCTKILSDSFSEKGYVVDNVSFSYADTNVLSNINFCAEYREFIGIVGESGSGKSTLVSLLMGRILPKSGHLYFGDQEINCSQLYKQVTYVSHDSIIFKGSVRDNLMMGGSYSDMELEGCLKRVNLELNLDHEIKERGSNLSGGQKQRLAIARALVHDTPFYIFDEVTSNIDVESEMIILDTIQQLRQDGKGIIMISHRLANCFECDRIYVLDKGEIVQWGEHASLMQTPGLYQELVKAQQNLEQYLFLKEGE
ncbi:ABC transporter ATP-binding protein/permease [Erysipelothrix rhusiopathiae]|nr:ABC transporter ATP-binding protein/permease [Erysipelothrix rhusiopathiae]MDE8261626.1 ABC transporter ATP-binding protein/permease [Erysipelothrix rhusiopathiae]MDE8320968.1 ABC transporter ATP-binding protein/permease [Erysipelothrix rhusiopathiae]